MDWFYYNLIILIKSCKIPYKNLEKALLFSKKQVFFLKIWKLGRTPTILQFNMFCWNFAHAFYLPMSTRGCVGIFFISFRSWITFQNLKIPGFYTLVFYTFINNSRSKQNKKDPTHTLVELLSRKRVQNFRKKYWTRW